MPYRIKSAVDPALTLNLKHYPVFPELTYTVQKRPRHDAQVGWYHQIHCDDACGTVNNCVRISSSGAENMLDLVDSAADALDKYYRMQRTRCPRHTYGHERTAIGACGSCFKHLHSWLKRKKEIMRLDRVNSRHR